MFAASSRFGPRSFNRGARAYASDQMGIVGFNTSGFPLVAPCPAFDHRLPEAITTLTSRCGGGTNLTAGLRESINLLKQAPHGFLRRCWLLTDGLPTTEQAAILPTVAEARAAWINVNCIGFGDPGKYDRSLLERIASGTHRGRFVGVQSLRELTDALLADQRPVREGRRWHHRAECTVLCLDLSGSMTEPMEGRRKVEVVMEACTRLLVFKQRCFS